MNNRKEKRIKIELSTSLNGSDLMTRNISKSGMLLYGDEIKSDSNKVKLRLKINGRDIVLDAQIMWVCEEKSNKTQTGICITGAPEAYCDFVDDLYLEAREVI